MKEIVWRKDGDAYLGEEPASHIFDALTWRVDPSRQVRFHVPATPPYWAPAMSHVTEAAVLQSLDEWLAQPEEP